MFAQIHMLQSMPPGNLNRDDTGQPKKCLFGNVTRGRISSQCLKRTIRRSEKFGKYLDGQALRSRFLPKLIAEQLADEDGFDHDEAAALADGLGKCFKSEKSGSAAEETPEAEESGNGNADLTTPQLVFFTKAFVKDIADKIRSERTAGAVKSKAKAKKWYAEFFKSNAAKIAKASEQLTPDVALFGRMTTSDLVVDVEATCQVAHAISTHETIIESDYFTAMDDLASEPGAAFLGSGDTETFFMAPVFYKYMNIDLDTLRDKNHLTEDFSVDDTATLAGAFLHAAMNTNPSGKQNSFASHGVPELVLVELGSKKQPISYANAFLEPVTGENLMKESTDALGWYVDSITTAYPQPDTKRLVFRTASAAKSEAKFPAEEIKTEDELIEAVQEAIRREA
jgi:CRISPR system Cascade subunit CasC